MSREEAAAKAICSWDNEYNWGSLGDESPMKALYEDASTLTLAAADAHDAAHGIHRVSLDEEKVAERAWNKLAERDSGRQWSQIGALNQSAWVGNIRVVLAAAVEAGQ